jgi:hypothetical protein
MQDLFQFEPYLSQDLMGLTEILLGALAAELLTGAA